MAIAACRRQGARKLRAFTLLELLVAMALTLIMVYALAEFYSYVGDTVRDGRAIIEMGGNLRSAQRQLRDDLNAVTVRLLPPISPGQGSGYFLIVEGTATDWDVNGDGTSDVGTMLGDADDILSMTIRATSAPFVGRRYNPAFNAAIGIGPNNQPYLEVESNLAEVIWFTTFKDRNGNFAWDADEERFLVRRVLLIRPDLTGALSTPTLGAGENFFHHNDISAHWTGTGWMANSLDDLTQRENRFIHLNLVNLNANGLLAANQYLPNPPVLHPSVNKTTAPADPRSTAFYTLQRTQDPNTGIVGDFLGEDHILPNVLAFDVRVYDPQAPLLGDRPDVIGVTPDDNRDDALAALQPGDAGYLAAILNGHDIAGYGAYVDLWYNRGLAQALVSQNIPVFNWPNSAFSWAPDAHNLPFNFRAQANQNPRFLDLNGNPMLTTWDSWSTYYERDSYDQDNDGTVDQGTDGLDNDDSGGVDDAGEAETHAPYPIWAGDNGVDDDLDGTIDEPPSMTPQLHEEGTVTRLPVAQLRGIQVRIRIYEPGTRQTRQATVVADFVPE